MEGSVWSKLQHVVLSSSVQGHGASRSVSGRATSFRDAYSDQAVHTLQEAGPKAGAQKQCRELSVSVDPPDHCRRDLESTAIHPDGDSVLLRRRTQVDHVGSCRHSLGSAGCCLHRCSNGGDVCRWRGEGEPLGSRRGVGGRGSCWHMTRGMPTSRGLVGRGPSGFGRRDVGCREGRWGGRT